MINAIYKSFENGILAQTRRWDVNKVKKETTWLICFLLSMYTLNISAGMNYTCWQTNSLQFLVEIHDIEFITSSVKITRDWWRSVSKLRANPLSSNEFSIPLNPAVVSLHWCEISAFNFRTSTEENMKKWAINQIYYFAFYSSADVKSIFDWKQAARKDWRQKYWCEKFVRIITQLQTFLIRWIIIECYACR